MSQKNARTKTADDILESLMDDLKDIDASIDRSDSGIEISDVENTSIELLDLGQSDEVPSDDDEALPLMADLNPKKDAHRSSFMISTSMHQVDSKNEEQSDSVDKEVKSLKLHSDEEVKTSIKNFDLNPAFSNNELVKEESQEQPQDNADAERTVVAARPQRKASRARRRRRCFHARRAGRSV